jgi:hypothetical protein
MLSPHYPRKNAQEAIDGNLIETHIPSMRYSKDRGRSHLDRSPRPANLRSANLLTAALLQEVRQQREILLVLNKTELYVL